MTEAKEVLKALDERYETGQRILDRWGTLQERYLDWKKRQTDVDAVYSNRWSVVWPDRTVTDGLPKIPNFVALAAEDRARRVASTIPVLSCPPETEKQRAAYEKRERILAGYWYMSRVLGLAANWAHDAMGSGLTAVRVLPDFAKATKDRYPLYQRLDPRFCYPDPSFTSGPFLDSMIVAYSEKWRVIARRYNAEATMAGLMKESNSDVVKMVEYYGPDDITIVASTSWTTPDRRSGRDMTHSRHEVLLDEKHGLSRCPVTIGVRPALDGVYRGDFDATFAVLNIWNKFMAMHLDEGIYKIYPPKVFHPDVKNKEDWGPDADLVLDNPQVNPQDAVAFIQSPSAPFSNIQMMNLMSQFARASALLPLSRSGDPNESVISAAGITATDAQAAQHVGSLLRDTLSPMLTAANELALEADEKLCDAPDKEIYGISRGRAFTEKYTPSRAIAGNYRNRVLYPAGAELGDINHNVMVLQQWQNGNGIISRRRAMEESPFVENPVEEEKQIALESLDRATFAGLVAQAEQGSLDPATLTRIRDMLETEGKTLSEAIAAAMPAAPMAQGPGAQGPTGAPGIPGAARGQQPEPPFGGPPLNELLTGPMAPALEAARAATRLH